MSTMDELRAEYRDLDAQYETLKERMRNVEKRKAEIARDVAFGNVASALRAEPQSGHRLDATAVVGPDGTEKEAA